MTTDDVNNYSWPNHVLENSLPHNVLNLLLVDDDQDDIDYFAEALKGIKLPHQLSLAMRSSVLFSLLEEGKIYDIIFLDLNMPEINGKQCLKLLKANPLYKDIPVIIFTGSKYQPDVDDSYELGAHYHFVKPYSHLNYAASLKIIFDTDWKKKPSVPPRDNFLINFTFN